MSTFGRELGSTYAESPGKIAGTVMLLTLIILGNVLTLFLLNCLHLLLILQKVVLQELDFIRVMFNSWLGAHTLHLGSSTSRFLSLLNYILSSFHLNLNSVLIR